MSPDFWERYINPDSRYRYIESPGLQDHGTEIWHSEGDTLKQEYSSIRDSELQTRTNEIFHKFTHFYFSRYGVIVLVISLVLSLITSTFSMEGLFFWNIFWNILFCTIVWTFYELTVRKKVRPDWDEIQEEIVI
jgi:hypothetical protein